MIQSGQYKIILETQLFPIFSVIRTTISTSTATTTTTTTGVPVPSSTQGFNTSMFYFYLHLSFSSFSVHLQWRIQDFPNGERQPQIGCANLFFLAIFSQEGARPQRPLGSVNDLHLFTEKHPQNYLKNYYGINCPLFSASKVLEVKTKIM